MGARSANLTEDGWIAARVKLDWWLRDDLIDALSTDFYQSKAETEKFEHFEIQDMAEDFEDKLEAMTDRELADAVWKMAKRTNVVEDEGGLWIDRYGLQKVQMNGYPEEGSSGL